MNFYSVFKGIIDKHVHYTEWLNNVEITEKGDGRYCLYIDPIFEQTFKKEHQTISM